jgi:hypothetical protein
MPFVWLFLIPKLKAFQRQNLKLSKRRPVVAFFHPFCDGGVYLFIKIGGGGERVLWAAIQGLLAAKVPVQIVLYVSDQVPQKDDLVKLVNVNCCIFDHLVSV